MRNVVGAAVALASLLAAAGAGAQPTPGVPLSESFDEVTAPGLPYGWAATNAQGPDPKWVTDTANPDTPPNAAHVDDPGVVADKRLDSPPVAISTAAAQLTFRHRFDLYDFEGGTRPEEPSGPIRILYDGAVLEISIDGGDFTDIVDAGGTFVQGGYVGPIQRPANPLDGRSAWSGSSIYITTVVNLPPTAAGTTVVFRWRMGSGGGNPGYTGWWVDSVRVCDGYSCDSALQPAGLALDTSGNGVLEVGETVDLETSYFNGLHVPFSATGAIADLTGPPGTSFTVVDSEAAFGQIPAQSVRGCADAGDCYAVTLSDPGMRPLQHWDAQLWEELSNGEVVVRAMHVGGSFADVPSSNPFYSFVETIFHRGVTGGCSGASYCPDDPALRKQMAVFLLKSKLGSAYVPPPAAGIFDDVPASDPFASWVENLYDLGITGGCATSPLRYCPEQTVLRRQMAVFLLKALNGTSYVPPACQGIFADVPCPSPFADWVEALYAQQIAAGCGANSFCPDNPNTRAQMSVFLAKTFGLTLYGP